MQSGDMTAMISHPFKRHRSSAYTVYQSTHRYDNWAISLPLFLACHQKHSNFYRCTIESILSGCITAWYGNCSAHNRKPLQRVVRSAQRITGGKLPALQDTYTIRCHRKAKKIIKDDNNPSHCLFTSLSSRRRGASKLGPRD
ncbi:unnamed protein product [Oncorhynchus mykiss]|uniref:Uncharacterized protein n=1 Tax=Oncorhynchus mykiss TaxID=8022 RepID=A0A060XIL0_ONCMY|nr:unnamed protein product [Oncorhynchus mykiss]